VLILGLAAPVAAQAPEPSTPAFSLASSQIYTTKERPAVWLMFRRVDHLDFRVYRVDDTLQFFAKLRDPHTLGSEEPVVPQERTLLERIAFWKAGWRDELRWFVRRQFSHDYRAARRELQEKAQIQRRRTVQVTNFAQVPLLNPSQLVTSWREILPPVRDAESRRIPLDLPGAGTYVLEAVNPPLRAYTVVIVSDAGLVAKTAPGQLLLFAADRFSGAPIPDCNVQVIAANNVIGQGRTDRDGLFETPLGPNKDEPPIGIARCGAQTTATDPGAFALREGPRELVGYIYTDKPVYRPGHPVRLKAILRWREKGALVPFERKPVEIAIADTNDKVVFRASRPVDEFGSASASYTLPSGAALGSYTIRVNSGDETATGSFDVQEYRKPEFDVAVRPAATFVVQGGNLVATVNARYYFGQPVAGASVKYVVHRQGYFSPYRYDGDVDDEGGDGWFGGDEIKQGSARLDARGTATLTIPLDVDERAQDYTARVEARVTDASGREVSGHGAAAATYGRFLIAARSDRYVYSPGARASIDLRTIDYEGAPQPGTHIALRLERVTYTGYGQPEKVDVKDQSSVDADTDGRASWSVAIPSEAGSYRIVASAPSDGRTVQTSTYLYVPGRTERVADEGDELLELVADKKTYQPGDVARLIVRGKSFDAPTLITKENQIVSYKRVATTRGNEAIEVPITDDDIGDTYVSIALLKEDRLYRAEKRLAVPALAKQLRVAVTAEPSVARPGQPVTIALQVTDRSGQPARAQASVGVVDEAVYGVRPDTTPDPLRFFYRREFTRVFTVFSRDYGFVGYSGTDQLQLARRHRPLTLADFKADRPERPQVRKEFPDTIYWIADLATDANGAARVQVTYPDSLTTWRITARAVTADARVGATIGRTLTTKDLILRVIAPRFLTEGDDLLLPTVVHNYLPSPKAIALTLQATGVEPASGFPAGPQTVQVNQNDQTRLEWPLRATTFGTATLTGTAKADTDSDAVELTLPVEAAGLKRRVTATGSIVEPGERSVTLTIPDSASPSAKTIQVSLAPSLAGSLLSALDYLSSYPYGCTEQTLSSFIPNLVVLKALGELKIAPTERLQSLDRQVTDGLKRLYDYQHDDGGWGWWKTDQNHPFMTAYALYGLLQARDNGYKVEPNRIWDGRNALRELHRKYPRAVPDLKAYVVYVLALSSEKPDSGAAPSDTDLKDAIEDVWAARGRMTPYGKALLLLTLDHVKDARGAELARDLMAAMQTRGDLAWWSTENDPLLDDFADTSVEATALALDALVRRDPKNAELEKVVRWLLLNRNGGWYWSSTKQTAMVLYGLLEYMRARGEKPASFSADVYVNGARAGTHAFDASALTAPDPVVVSAPATGGANAVRIVKQGAGALYFSAAGQYFDKPAAAERTGTRKLAITRNYYALAPVTKNGRIVYRESAFSGNAAPGDVILVRLTTAGSTDWRYLMIEDPLPAGAEAIEQDALYEMERRTPRWWGSRRELHDDRVVFFQERFDRGRYEFTYLLKVITPGVFRAMPAQIAPMYVPDVSASSDTQTLKVTSPTAAPPGTRTGGH